MPSEPSALSSVRGADPFPIPLRLRVLVVDDNRDAADSTTQLLNVCGAEAEASYNGSAALDVLARFAPDVCILDLGMPKMGGCELAERIRQESVGEAPLLIALTAVDDDDGRRQTAAAGFDYHFVKPIDPAHLLHILGQEMTRRRMLRASASADGNSSRIGELHPR